VLREFKHVRQEPVAGYRRWFESDGFDVIFWFDADASVSGFQICYDFGEGEHALTWRRGLGCVHHKIDQGPPGTERNLTPILVADGVAPWSRLLKTFEARNATLEPSLRSLVRQQLAAGAGHSGV
jgi:hypothetical protein